jgi:hypothetical protein
MQRVEAQKRELDKQIQALQSDLKRIRSGAKDARTIVVNLVVDGAGDMRVSYQVRGAGWSPTYRAALDSASSRVEPERQAVVSQTTGEDWTGVKIRSSRFHLAAMIGREWSSIACEIGRATADFRQSHGARGGLYIYSDEHAQISNRDFDSRILAGLTSPTRFPFLHSAGLRFL